jgi:hypothetical protein
VTLLKNMIIVRQECLTYSMFVDLNSPGVCDIAKKINIVRHTPKGASECLIFMRFVGHTFLCDMLGKLTISWKSVPLFY